MAYDPYASVASILAQFDIRLTTAEAGATPTPTPAPAFTSLPSITGTPTEGQSFSALTFTDGTVSNGNITARAYLLAGSAVASSYTPTSADVGKSLVFRNTATGTGGSVNASSQAATVVAAVAPPAPLTARRSIDFGKSNGIDGQSRALAAPSITNFMRTGSVTAPATLFFVAQVGLDGLRGTAMPNQNIADSDLRNSSVIFSNGSVGSASYHLEYFGSKSAFTSRRGRFYFRSQGTQTVEPTSAQWLSDEPVMVAVVNDGTQIWVDLIKTDGTIIDGKTQGVPVTLTTYVGVAAPTNTTWIGRINTIATTGNTVAQGHKGCISNFGYVRRALSDTEKQRIARGETPAAVIADGTLDRWYRMDGPTDLVKTGGVATLADLTPTYVGSDMTLQAGPSLLPANDGAAALKADLMPFGYVVGVDPDAATAEHNMPLPTVTNTAGGSTHIQARAVVYKDGQTVHKNWTRITSAPLAAGATLTGAVLPMRASPPVVIEYRREDVPTVAVSGFGCGVGVKVILDGQSREVFSMCDRAADTTTLDANVAGADSNVSMFVHRNHFGFEGRIQHGFIRERNDAGEGAKRIAKEWSAKFPNVCLSIVMTAVSGQGRNYHYNNGVSNGTAGALSTWGDNVTPGSGLITDLLTFACRGTNRDITGWSQRTGSADFGTTSRYVGRQNSYYYGNARDTVGDGDTGAPPRFWTQASVNLAYGIKRIFLGRIERYALAGRDGTEASRISKNDVLLLNQSITRAFMNDTVIPASIKRWGALVNDHSFKITDELHFDIDRLDGTTNQIVRDIPSFASLAGLATIDNNLTPPTSFTLNGGRTTATMTLTPRNGGTFKTKDGGATVGGWQVTTNFTAGTPIWTDTSGQLSGALLVFTGAWSGVADADLRFRYLNKVYPNFTYGSGGQFADQASAIVAENAELDRHLFETNALLSTTVSAGVMMVESTTPVAPV